MRKTRVTPTPLFLFTLAFSVNACSGGGGDDLLIVDGDASVIDGQSDSKVDGTAGKGGDSGGKGGNQQGGSAGEGGSQQGGSAGEGGGQQGGNAGEGGSAGQTCATATDCPDTNNECTVPACVDSNCRIENVPKSTPTATQNDGDCKQAQCDGNGGVIQANDDTDIPDDNNSCTIDTCLDGSPKHTPKALGESCGNGQVCDGAGKCVGCNTAENCPGEDTFCATRTCTSNECGMAYQKSQTPLPTEEQTAGDCGKLVCDDAGKAIKVFDATDPEDDNNQCTVGECSADYSTVQKPVDQGTPCLISGLQKGQCDGRGACVECITDPDCKSKHLYCDTSHTCQPFRVLSITPHESSVDIEPDTVFLIGFPREIDPSSITTQPNFGSCTKSSSLRFSFDDFVKCLPFKCIVNESDTKQVVCNLPMTLSYFKEYTLKVGTTLRSSGGLALENDYHAKYTVKRPNELGCNSPTDVVISQIYANGGVSDDGYKADFVVLRNRSISDVDLNGWSLQYTSEESPGVWKRVNLENTIEAGGYYLIKGFDGPKGRNIGPSHVQFDFDIDTTTGVVALVAHQEPLQECPELGSSEVKPPRDLVGFGSTTCFRKTVAPSPDDMQLLRRNDGCTCENDNGADFRVGQDEVKTVNTPIVDCTCGFNGSKETKPLADYCQLLEPGEMSFVAGIPSDPVIGSVKKDGLTTVPGIPDSKRLKAQVGWGPVDVNPSTQCGYTFKNATYSPMGTPGSDEARYTASFIITKPGTYRYVYRFSVDGGETWLYCNLNKTLPSDGNFDITRLGTLEVRAIAP